MARSRNTHHAALTLPQCRWFDARMESVATALPWSSPYTGRGTGQLVWFLGLYARDLEDRAAAWPKRCALRHLAREVRLEGVETSFFDKGDGAIVLSGPSCAVGSPSAAAFVQATVSELWHELGHRLHSFDFEIPDLGRLGVASSELEDLRIEARLVEQFGDKARAWLRYNFDRHLPTGSALSEAVDQLGEARVATRLVGRAAAGVIDAATAERLTRELKHVGASVDPTLTAIWRQYAAVRDNRISSRRAVEAYEQLALRLPATATLL